MKIAATIILSCTVTGSVAQATQAQPDATSPPPVLATSTTTVVKKSVATDVTPPVLLHRDPPQYSEEAKRAQFSGSVEVFCVLDEEGNPTNVRVEKGVGMGLDEKAVEAVRGYKYLPAMKDGKPIQVNMHIKVNFQIFAKDK